jgi:hypothetical protein
MPSLSRNNYNSDLVSPATLTETTLPSGSSNSLIAKVFSKMRRQLQEAGHIFGGTETPVKELGVDLALDVDGVLRVGDSWQFRTGYTAASLFCMLLLALMLGKSFNFTEIGENLTRRSCECALYSDQRNNSHTVYSPLFSSCTHSRPTKTDTCKDRVQSTYTSIMLRPCASS